MGLSKPQTAADTGTLMDNHRFLLLKVVKGQHPQHRPPVVGVVIGDTVHNPTDFFGDPSWGLAVIIFHMEKGYGEVCSVGDCGGALENRNPK